LLRRAEYGIPIADGGSFFIPDPPQILLMSIGKDPFADHKRRFGMLRVTPSTFLIHQFPDHL
jgi:hypothetical protein